MPIFSQWHGRKQVKKHGWFSKWLILPTVAVTMVSSLFIGFTMAFFNDPETSNANTSTAWASTQWTQTSKSDFEAGVLSNVNTISSSGNVILGAGGGSGANLILFWDGGTAPTGWDIISQSGEPFFNVFPKGAATYGGTGGAASHTHTVSLVSVGPPSATTQVSGSGTNRASVSHTHTLNNQTVDTASNLPVYRQLRVIQYTSGIPTTIPAGAIAIFDTTPPAGWTQYSAQDGYFIRTSGSGVGNTGGSNTHSHSVTVSLTSASGDQTVSTTTPRVSVATNVHTHGNASGTTDTSDNRPPYITVILAKANSDTAIPYGMIAMFNATPSGDWNVLSGPGGPFNSRFILPSTSYGATGGTSSHTQSNLVITSKTNSGNGNASTSSPTASVAGQDHTHDITVSFNNQSHLPPYVDVVFAKALYYSSGTIASQVLDTGVAGSRWDGICWDRTLPSGTTLTLEVRAQDASFAKDAGSPSWTPIGGISPVISGLPSGRYKQWRATLTSDGTRTSTSTLQEVRVYYYGN